MAAERDAFGFYFSAHPVDRARHLLAAHKVRTFAELAEIRDRRGRARRREHGRAGRRRALARLGQGPALHDGEPEDRSGQFVATAFDDEPTAALEAAAKAGACGLLTVELDRRAGDDSPRVTIKRFQPLDATWRSGHGCR